MAQFRLATLLKIRERDRDLAAKNVQDARAAIDHVEKTKQELIDQNNEMIQLRKNAINGLIPLSQVLDAQRYQMVLEAQIQHIDAQLGKLRQELQRREIALLKCQQSVKSLEKLRDQRIDAAEVQALMKQQERLDEWSSIRHAMNVQTNVEET